MKTITVTTSQLHDNTADATATMLTLLLNSFTASRCHTLHQCQLLQANPLPAAAAPQPDEHTLPK
jgi:hypothetical protein